MIGLAALLVAAAELQSSVAGLYRAQQMEVGAKIELRKDSHFRYQLDYGAVFEQSEGDWSFDGKTVRLTSRPMPKAPSFELVRDDPAAEGELIITLEPPGFAEDFRMEAIATDAETGEKGLITADEQGRVDSGTRKISGLDPLAPVYGTVGGHFPLSPGRGHHLRLRSHPNNLGRAAFVSEPLAVTSRGLLLVRYDTEIRFVRVRP